jgi:uncharacterized protein YqgQ
LQKHKKTNLEKIIEQEMHKEPQWARAGLVIKAELRQEKQKGEVLKVHSGERITVRF